MVSFSCTQKKVFPTNWHVYSVFHVNIQFIGTLLGVVYTIYNWHPTHMQCTTWSRVWSTKYIRIQSCILDGWMQFNSNISLSQYIYRGNINGKIVKAFPLLSQMQSVHSIRTQLHKNAINKRTMEPLYLTEVHISGCTVMCSY